MSEAVVVTGGEGEAAEVIEEATEAVEASAEATEAAAEAVEAAAEAVEAVAEAAEEVAETTGEGAIDVELHERVTLLEERLNTHIGDYDAHSGVRPSEVVAIAENVVETAAVEDAEPVAEEVTIVAPDVEPEPEKRSLLHRIW